MSITKEQIIEEISKMSLIEVNELVKMIEIKFSIKYDDFKKENNNSNNLKEEKTKFSIILKSTGPNKLVVIKYIRSLLSLGLKESKNLVESCPVILKENINKDEIDIIKKNLEDMGSIINIE